MSLWLVGPVSHTFVQHLIAFCSRPEAASDIIFGASVGLIVPNKPVKFRDPRLNRFREIPPEAVGSGIFNSFFCDNVRLEVDSDVISGVAVE